MQPIAADYSSQADRRLAWAVYVLYGLGILSGGFLMLVGLVIAHVKSDSVGAIFASHLRHLIRTAWTYLVLLLLGLVLTPLLVGFPILLCAWLWLVYRVAKGALRLNEGLAF